MSMRAFRYGMGAILTTAVVAAGAAVPAAADSTTTTNIDSNNTVTITKTFTHLSTFSFNNSGIIQKQAGGYEGEGGGRGTQIAVQGNYSGVYKVNIYQDQKTIQKSSNTNYGGDQSNFTYQTNYGWDQSNNQTNSNSQSQNQSNSSSQTQSVSQSAQGVTL